MWVIKKYYCSVEYICADKCVLTTTLLYCHTQKGLLVNHVRYDNGEKKKKYGLKYHYSYLNPEENAYKKCNTERIKRDSCLHKVQITNLKKQTGVHTWHFHVWHKGNNGNRLKKKRGPLKCWKTGQQKWDQTRGYFCLQPPNAQNSEEKQFNTGHLTLVWTQLIQIRFPVAVVIP